MTHEASADPSRVRPWSVPSTLRAGSLSAMRRVDLIPIALFAGLIACGPSTPDPDPAMAGWSGGSQDTEAPDGLPARADCAGAVGLVQLDLPQPPDDADLTVFALTADSINSEGVPTAPPVADVVVSIDPLQQGGPFPVSYRICVPEGPHVLLAAVDAQGDQEVLGEGDYIGRTEVVIPGTGTIEANIMLDQVLTAAQAKKGEKPKEQTRRKRR